MNAVIISVIGSVVAAVLAGAAWLFHRLIVREAEAMAREAEKKQESLKTEALKDASSAFEEAVDAYAAGKRPSGVSKFDL